MLASLAVVAIAAQSKEVSDAQISKIYAQCAGCHGAEMEGGQFGPALKGRAFAVKWAGKRAALRDFVVNAMPPAEPGSLSQDDYDAVIAMIADANGGLSKAAPALPHVAGEMTSENILGGQVGPRRSEPHVFRDAIYEKAIAARHAKLQGLKPVTEAMLRAPPEGDWLSWRRTADEAGYSPLAEIDRKTVSHLTLKWAWSLPIGTNEIAPLVHDGVMFLNSANEIQALDATDGTLLWRYRRALAPQYRGAMNSMQRSFALLDSNVYVSTADRHVIALDARSGAVVWDREVVPPELPGVLLSSGPFVAGGVIIQGTSMGPACSGGCFVVGLDAQTGKQLWRFDTVARPGQPGGDSWNGMPVEKRSGGAVWVAGSYDPDLDLVYFGTAGTYGVSGLLEPGPDGKMSDNDALYTNATIALRLRTGKLVWYHQHFPRELWDLDEVFERTLIDLPIEGRLRRLVVTTGKLGILDALDRIDGSYVFSKDFGLNNLITAVDPKTGRRSIDPARVPTANRPVEICPSAEGVRNWMATAYNPHTRILYLPMQENCMTLVWRSGAETASTRGKLDIGWSLTPPPGSDGKYGRVEAVDMVTRKTLWLRRERALPSSTLLATGGGLLFSGNADRWFRALDDMNGKVLWETRLNAVPNATPITFRVAGRQYVAITTGGGGAHDVDTVEVTPELATATPAVTLLVFGLSVD